MITELQAKNIVNAVLSNLDGRRGFHLISELRGEDHEVYNEMYATLVKVTMDAERDRADPTESYYYPEEYIGT